ncbi:MAG TPA: DUF5060 domain-containing protein [Bryobacteraceae bacterium]|nr:DUF5060 domain-containing protein [Bryobacteraceae bacterium]
MGCSLLALGVFLSSLAASAAGLPSCSEGARTFEPCELTFDWQNGELPQNVSPYKDELLNIEFRSPDATTYLMRAFWDGGHTLRVRFSPTEPGAWKYRISSSIKRYDDHESSFNVGDSGRPGFVGVANLRHWWTTNKKPHLWMSAAVPFLAGDQTAFEQWLDARKHDGFTHIRGTLLTLDAGRKPLLPEGTPDFSYFNTLDTRLLAANQRGFTMDLILASCDFVRSGALENWDQRDPLIRYLVARYGALDVTWQGIEHFEDVPGARAMLKELGIMLLKYDSFQHPRSTDARVSSSPLLADGWENYLIEASPHPEVGAVEHQFTQQPEIHVITATDPDAFRHELWTSTTNGEYPSISYQSLRNEANAKAVAVWFKVISDTRHWELEPYFGVDGARAVGLQEVEYLAYAEKPGIVEITLPKHKYNPVWVNPTSGEEIPLKDYRGEVFSRQTPDNAHDWVLQVPREGHKESMLKSYYFESQDPPVQEIELDSAKTPFEIAEPSGDTINMLVPTPYGVKLTRANRATRTMQYVWWGEVVAGGEGARVLAVGPSGNFTIPRDLIKGPGSSLTLRLLALNALGKAYEVDKVYRLTP